MLRTANVVPKTYDELFRHYYPLVKGMVKKANVHPQLCEDVAMVLIEKIIEKDLLSQFDPEYVAANGKKINFSSYLSGFVMAYVRHLAARTRIDADRNRTYMNQESSEELRTEDWLSWMDYHGFTHEDDHSQIEYALIVHRVRAHLRGLPVKGKKNFSELFELVLEQLEETGKVHKADLAEKMNCAPSHITTMMRSLGEHIREAQAC